jgi:malate dehydrogenase
MKLNTKVTELRLYDIVNTPGVAADIGHISTPAKVTGHVGPEQLADAVKGCDLVLIPAGVPRKPGMTRDDLFNTNASIVAGLAEACAENCPDAAMAIIANPVNSTVPITAEVYKKKGVYNPKKLFGVTTLDVVRAEAFIAESQGWNVLDVSVPVVGGHAGTTILPLLSQTKNSKGLEAKWSQEEIGALTHRIQFGGDEVVKAKDGAGSATLSMAMAAARFSDSLLRAMDGEKDIVECCFVESDVTENTFFSSPVALGKDGVEEIFGMGEISEFEKQGFETMIGDLGKQIQKGVDFTKA